MKKLRRIKKLEDRIKELEKIINEENKEDKECFNPIDLLKVNCKVCSYEKDNQTYYYLKKVLNFWRLGFSSYITGEYNEKEKSNLISPDFKSKKELYIWVFENYKKLNKKEEDE